MNRQISLLVSVIASTIPAPATQAETPPPTRTGGGRIERAPDPVDAPFGFVSQQVETPDGYFILYDLPVKPQSPRGHAGSLALWNDALDSAVFVFDRPVYHLSDIQSAIESLEKQLNLTVADSILRHFQLERRPARPEHRPPRSPDEPASTDTRSGQWHAATEALIGALLGCPDGDGRLDDIEFLLCGPDPSPCFLEEPDPRTEPRRQPNDAKPNPHESDPCGRGLRAVIQAACPGDCGGCSGPVCGSICCTSGDCGLCCSGRWCNGAVCCGPDGRSCCQFGVTCCGDFCCAGECCQQNCCEGGSHCCGDGVCCPDDAPCLTEPITQCCNIGHHKCDESHCCGPDYNCCGDGCCPPELPSCCEDAEGRDCCDPLTEQCCGHECCPLDGTCCDGKCCSPVQLCCGDTCCNPQDCGPDDCCDPNRCANECCTRQEYCCDETSCCADGLECCNGQCCEEGKICCNETACCKECCNGTLCCNGECCGENGCCAEGFQCCPTGDCCPDDWECCTDGCCPPDRDCCEGPVVTNCCLPGVEECCGGNCCLDGETCRDGLAGICCPTANAFCNGVCCQAGNICCGAGGCCDPTKCCTDQCCGETEYCCGANCCEIGRVCCGDTCCGEDQICCGGECCDEDQCCDDTVCCSVPNATAGGTGGTCGITLTLKEITFCGDHTMYEEAPPSDSSGNKWGAGLALTSPDWRSEQNPDHPACYTRNTPLCLSVRIEVSSSGPSGGTGVLRVVGPDGVTGEGDFSIPCGTEDRFVTLTTTPLPNVVKAYTPGNLTWSFLPPGGTTFTPLGSTQHDIYVTFGTPAGSLPTARRMNMLCNAAAQAGTELEVIEGAPFGGEGIHERLDNNPPRDGCSDPCPPQTPDCCVDHWSLMASWPYQGECDEQARFMVRSVHLIGGPMGTWYNTWPSRDCDPTQQESASAAQAGITWDLDGDGAIGEELVILRFDFPDNGQPGGDGSNINAFEGSVEFPSLGRYYAVWPSLESSSKCELLLEVEDTDAVQCWALASDPWVCLVDPATAQLMQEPFPACTPGCP